MVRRNIGTNTYNLAYDAENRLVQVTGAVTETFKYNGDGQRIIATQGITTTIYIGNYFEWHGTTADMVKYYYSGGTRVAMRVGTGEPVYLMGDHLGSTSVAVDEQGAPVGGSPQLYKAWGETRAGSMPTAFRFTGQREDSYIKLYWYGARWYDPYINRWTSPDSIISNPNYPQSLDRYGYVSNNALRYIDPSGHRPCQGKNSGGAICDDVTIKDLESLLSIYGWKYDGTETGALLKRQLETILDSGLSIESYVNRVGGWGIGWIRRNMGNAIYYTGPEVNKAFGYLSAKRGWPILGMTPWFNHIFLPNFFTVQTVTHELGHVLDNNFIKDV
jgi:RHS repeat-associated protein